MQSHFALRTLKGNEKPYRDSQALFSTEPTQRAMLFIHGFSGNSVSTWSNFHELLQDSNAFSGYDVYFYGYDGLRSEMNASAAIFRAFIDCLFTNTIDFINSNLPPSINRDSHFKYEELTIVAHSLGAVISRRALIDATRAACEWAPKVKLVLFAPAHKGAKVAELALEASGSFPFLKWFGVGIRFESPLIDQLRPKSEALNTLLKDTIEQTEKGNNKHLNAKKVIIAEYEKIVSNDSFGDDPPPNTIPNTTHMSVCKPTKEFLRPLALLEADI